MLLLLFSMNTVKHDEMYVLTLQYQAYMCSATLHLTM